jgi:hypothetical protein
VSERLDPRSIHRRKRKRRGSERNQLGSERSGTGSDRTQGGSDGSQHQDDSLEEDGREARFDIAAQFMEPSEGWWTAYGYESLGTYLRELEPKGDPPSLRAAKLPSGAAPQREPGPYARTRQVSIRLHESAYEALVKVASMYGVPPSTMGRLLVSQGARKAVEDA